MTNRFEILVVEDNPGDQLLIRQGFEAASISHRLHFAENGTEAMAFLGRTGPYAHSPRPHLIVLDLNLTRKDGREILAELKRETKLVTIPVVIFTTSNANNDIERCYRLGANAFLTKPADLDAFIDMIRTMSEFWLNKISHCRVED